MPGVRDLVAAGPGGVRIGGRQAATGTSTTVAGLTNGTSYTFTVAATNRNGVGILECDHTDRTG
jgi:hypothetical protein